MILGESVLGEGILADLSVLPGSGTPCVLTCELSVMPTYQCDFEVLPRYQSAIEIEPES